MTDQQAGPASVAHELDRLNAAHAAWFGKAPLEVRFQPLAEGIADALFVYGVLGAKDVGKSTFLEALVGEPVNREKQGLNRGTDEVVAFLHASALEPFRHRLEAIGKAAFRFLDGWNADPIGAGGPVPVRVFVHRRDDLARVVFLDLPDFSSIFEEHRRILDAVSPSLNGFLWLTSTNYNLQTFADMVRRQNKSTGNYWYVVNKADLIADDYGTAQLAQFRERVTQDLARMVPKEARVEVLLISARRPAEFDLPALRKRLVREHAVKEIEEAKRRNVHDGFHKVAGEIETYYGAASLREGIDRVVSEIPDRVAEELPGDYRERVATRILEDEDALRKLRSRYLSHCVKKWPILRTLHMILTPIAGWAARRLSSVLMEEPGPRTLEEIATVGGRGLAERVASAQGALREAHWEAHRALRGTRADLPAEDPAAVGREVLARVGARDAEVREEALEAAKAAYKGPGAVMRLLLFFPIVWFPFVQPILQMALTMWADSGVVEWSRVALLVVSVLGASHVIQSLAVLAMVYVLFLIGLASRCNARITEARSEPLFELWREALPQIVVERLSRPYEEARTALAGLAQGVDDLRSRVGDGRAA